MNTVLNHAAELENRWRGEVGLLACIAPAPIHRWYLFAECGDGTLNDFSWEDTRIIADAIERVYRHRHEIPGNRSRDIAAKLAMAMLKCEHLWEPNDCRTMITSSRWGPGPLALLFTHTGDRKDEPDLIAAAVSHLRTLPRFIEPTTREAA